MPAHWPPVVLLVALTKEAEPSGSGTSVDSVSFDHTKPLGLVTGDRLDRRTFAETVLFLLGRSTGRVSLRDPSTKRTQRQRGKPDRSGAARRGLSEP